MKVTIFEALAWAGEALKASAATPKMALQNPKLDAQIMLAECLEKPTSFLFAHGEETLDPDIYERFQRLIERRARHEPVAYLLGYKEFYGRPFYVNPSVLIPRPETEILVDLAKKRVEPNSAIVDIGTGSGAIAITLAAETGAPTYAVDTDIKALNVAKTNAKYHSVDNRIAFHLGHLFQPLEMLTIAPHIVVTANLPYLSPWQVQSLDPDVRDYEPRLALVGGADGLALYDELFGQLRAYLHECSRKGTPVALDVIIEIDPSQQLTAPHMIKAHFPSAIIAVIKDLADRSRFVTMSYR